MFAAVNQLNRTNELNLQAGGCNKNEGKTSSPHAYRNAYPNSCVVKTTRSSIELEMDFARHGVVAGKNQISDGLAVFQRGVAGASLRISYVDGDVAHGQ